MGMDDLYVIVNHFKSKSQDTEEVQYTLPRREEQARFVGGLVQQIRASDWGAKVIVLGDLNDFLDSETLAVLEDAGLMDLLYETPKPNRYTYTYKGESEVLDHILINQRIWRSFRSLEPIHINADYPIAFEDTPDLSRRSSDHDPEAAKFMLRYWWGW
jgi:predicted extracellular nuclease